MSICSSLFIEELFYYPAGLVDGAREVVVNYSHVKLRSALELLGAAGEALGYSLLAVGTTTAQALFEHFEAWRHHEDREGVGPEVALDVAAAVDVYIEDNNTASIPDALYLALEGTVAGFVFWETVGFTVGFIGSGVVGVSTSKNTKELV